ncbi:hypothetical protein ACLK1S_06710 [Escherichia coli]
MSSRVANLTVIVSSKRRRVSVARFSCGKTAQLSKKQTGYYSPEIFPSTGKDCNPQPANCLKINTSYAIAAWMIGRAKWVIP